MSERREPRPRRDWGDEDDEPRRPKGGSGISVLLIVALALVCFCVLGVGVIGVLGYLGLQRTVEAQRAMVAEMEARAQADVARAEAEMARDRAEAAHPWGDGPMPPPPGPPPQPQLTPFDRNAASRNWTILFRAKDPALWGTDAPRFNDFAVSLRYAPLDTKYLRLRRMDTGDTLIIAIKREQLAGAANVDRLPGWNGTARDEYGGRHLGIVVPPRYEWQTNEGMICLQNDGFDAFGGSGFGHKHMVDGARQRYAWKGKEIPPTAFEIAVAARLSPAEQELLVGGESNPRSRDSR
jgi:hypothetical protein